MATPLIIQMALNKLCRCTVLLFAIILASVLVFVPTSRVKMVPDRTLCTAIREHISCVHCFRQKVSRDPMPLTFMYPETPYSFLASFATCREFTCEEMLQVIDESKVDLSIEITKEVNDYLDVMHTTIVRPEVGRTVLGVEGKAWALFTRQLGQNTPYIVYNSRESGMYSAIVETVLLFTSIVILVWDSRNKNQGAPSTGSSRSPITLLVAFSLTSLIPLFPLQATHRFWLHLCCYFICYLLTLYKSLSYIQGAQPPVLFCTTLLICLIERAKVDHQSLAYAQIVCFGLLLPVVIIFVKTCQINRKLTVQEVVSSVGCCMMIGTVLVGEYTSQEWWEYATMVLMNCVPVLLTINISEEGFSKIQSDVDIVEEEENQATLS